MTLFILLLMAFVLSHIGMATPGVRDRLVARLGDGGFQAVYALISLALLIGALRVYRGLEPEILWVAPTGAWHLATLVMLLASILFVGSLTPANKGLAGVPVSERPASGAMRITRHPMMWSFGLWALVHATLSGSLPTVILAAGIGILALGGAAHQDLKKRRLMGPVWERYERETSYWPLGAQVSGKQPWSALWPGLVPVVGGVALWAVLTFVHPVLMQAPMVPPWSFAAGGS
ncbi:MAG: NnrU family protein [Sandaracinobacteroides sp.]